MKGRRGNNYARLNPIGTILDDRFIGGIAAVRGRLSPFGELLIEISANGAKGRVTFGTGSHPPDDREILVWVCDYLFVNEKTISR